MKLPNIFEDNCEPPLVCDDESQCPAGALILKPGVSTICIGGTVTFLAFFEFEDGECRVTTGLAFASSEMQIAIVDSLGTVTAISEGRVTISATWRGYLATAEIDVKPGSPCCDDELVSTVLLIDNSVSMTQPFGSFYGSKLDVAKAIGQAMAVAVQTKDTLAVLSFSEAPYTEAEPENDPASLRLAVNSIEQTDMLTDLVSALAGALRVVQGTKQLVP